MGISERRVVIRRANVEDAHIVAKAAMMAIGEEEVYGWLGDKGGDVFYELAMNENTPYSYTNSLVAEVLSDEPRQKTLAGAVIGYDGALHLKQRKVLYDIVAKHLGYYSEFELETGPGEFYADSLGVLEGFRGMGLGTMLLTSMRDFALEMGFVRVKLLVDVEKIKAIELYKSLGFKKIKKRLFLGKQMWEMVFE